MKRLLFAQGSLSVLAGWVLLMHWPMVETPKVKAKGLTPEAIESEVKHEYAMQEANQVLAAYNCGSDYSGFVVEHALVLGVSPRLVAATIAIESSCRSRIVSDAGAIGLMQIMPKIWKVDGDLRDPEVNIAAGTRILAEQVHRYGKREGLKRYYGITEGSTASDEYADKILAMAKR